MSKGYLLNRRVSWGFFDFDKTLVRQNSFALLCRQLSSKLKLVQAATAACLPGGGSSPDRRQRLRMAVYRHALKGCSQEEFEAAAREIAQQLEYNETVVRAMADLDSQGCTNVIVTASPRLVVETFLKAVDLPVDKIIGTELQFANGRFTGHLLGPECVKAEKVARMHLLHSPEVIRANAVAFGNLPDDAEMLHAVRIGFTVDPRTGLVCEAYSGKEFRGCQFDGASPLQILNRR